MGRVGGMVGVAAGEGRVRGMAGPAIGFGCGWQTITGGMAGRGARGKGQGAVGGWRLAVESCIQVIMAFVVAQPDRSFQIAGFVGFQYPFQIKESVRRFAVEQDCCRCWN